MSDEDDETSTSAVAKIVIEEEEGEFGHQSKVVQSRSMGEIVRKHSASDGEKVMKNGPEKVDVDPTGPQRSKSQDAVACSLNNQSMVMSTTSSWSSVSSSKPLIMKRDQANDDHPLV